MRLDYRDRFAELEPLLAFVERPSRYLNHEWGAVADQSGPLRCCLIYPDVYEVGQANLGLQILYSELNAQQGISCARAFLPWCDMADAMRAHDIPLLSLEGAAPVASFDVVGISLAHELVATNLIETLDLARITLLARERDEDEPIVLAGGPSVWNAEPFCDLFDAIVLGDGEGVTVRVARTVERGRAEGRARAEILRSLAEIQGVYVPSLYEVCVDASSTRWGYARPRAGTGAPEVVYKHCIRDLAATEPCPQRIVPFAEVVQDRLAIEVMRGCARGCRFCQAGMTYRPVRERPAQQVIDATERGLDASGFDECSLSSLSTTDHAECQRIVDELKRRLAPAGVRVSIPSQRLDAFGVQMASTVASSRKAGLTFAPEAATQRLRDVINKNVTEQDLLTAAGNAFQAGYRRMKLYFMLGLPTERDEDVEEIGERAYEVVRLGREVLGPRAKVTCSVSVAVFVPKAHTPFQWAGQLSLPEVRRRQQLMLDRFSDRALKVSYHDAETSVVEGALSKMGRAGLDVVMAAWRRGARFDAWTDQFDYARWQAAAHDCGLDLEEVAAESFDVEARLPWDHTSPGVSKGYLQREWRRALAAEVTPDCTRASCTGCGVCPTLGVDNVLAGERR